MALQAGMRFGSFEIVGSLGAGGMGEVYRGRDTRLDRNVAIKVLPPEFSTNEDRLRRFEQEARSASALNHPNIITIHEIGLTDSRPFIVMEFVDGKTLRELLQSGPIPARKAVQIVTQIADGLAKAHEAGIVHRDLKPENIMVTNDGFVKILDFGLAKILLPEKDQKVSILPTAAKTDVGVVLGTVGYMSPEQASGSEIDFRSDQFSFGAILYEMISGKRAFQKNTSVETLAAIISQEPEPLPTSNVVIAAPLRWILDECLEKNPKDRYASTRDLARDLQNIRDHFSEVTNVSTTIESISPARTRKNLHKAWDIIAAILILALASALIYLLRAPADEKSDISYHRLTYRRGPIHSARFTTDGQTIVYSASWEGGRRELFVTRPEAVESRSLGIFDSDILSISPAGEMLLLIRKGFGVLAQAPLTGGVPREIAENVAAAGWTPDGKNMAMARYSAGKTKLEYPPEKVLFETARDIQSIRFSPQGNLIAFIEHNFAAVNGRVLVVDLNGKKVMDSGEWYPFGMAWSPSGKNLFITTLSIKPGGGMELYSVDLSGKRRFVAPFAWSSVDDISIENRLLMRIEDRRMLAISVPEGEERTKNLTWLDQSEVADFSPDGQKILIHERGEGSEFPSGTIYIVKSDGTSGFRLAGGNPTEFSPDGKSVLAYVGGKDLMIISVGAGKTRTILAPSENATQYPSGFLPDGKRILLSLDEGKGETLQVLDLATGIRKHITNKYHALSRNTISPDGSSVLATGHDNRYYIVSLADGSGRLIPGLEKEEEPLFWNRDGKSVFAIATQVLPLRIYKVDVTNGSRSLFKEIVPPDPAGFWRFSNWIVSDDEKAYAYSYTVVYSTLYSIQNLN